MALHLAILIFHLLFIVSALKAELKMKLKHAYFSDRLALLKHLSSIKITRVRFGHYLGKNVNYPYKSK